MRNIILALSFICLNFNINAQRLEMNLRILKGKAGGKNPNKNQPQNQRRYDDQIFGMASDFVDQGQGQDEDHYLFEPEFQTSRRPRGPKRNRPKDNRRQRYDSGRGDEDMFWRGVIRDTMAGPSVVNHQHHHYDGPIHFNTQNNQHNYVTKVLNHYNPNTTIIGKKKGKKGKNLGKRRK